jgi:CO/xanthine dehydrogenase FAD-binding subunit
VAFVRPVSLVSALEARADLPYALIVAGGTVVQPAMNAGRLRPEAVLDLSGLRDGRSIDRAGARLRLGPVVSVAQAARNPVLGPGVLGPMMPGFANPAVRERATLIGNVFQPPRDLAVALITLDAALAVGRTGGPERPLALADLVLGADAVGASELAIGLEVTVPSAFACERLARRRVSAPTLAAVAAAVLADGPRVAISGALLPGTRSCPDAAALLPDSTAEDEFGDAVAREAAPLTPYARSALRTLARRCHRRVHGGPDE